MWHSPKRPSRAQWLGCRCQSISVGPMSGFGVGFAVSQSLNRVVGLTLKRAHGGPVVVSSRLSGLPGPKWPSQPQSGRRLNLPRSGSEASCRSWKGTLGAASGMLVIASSRLSSVVGFSDLAPKWSNRSQQRILVVQSAQWRRLGLTPSQWLSRVRWPGGSRWYVTVFLRLSAQWPVAPADQDRVGQACDEGKKDGRRAASRLDEARRGASRASAHRHRRQHQPLREWTIRRHRTQTA